MYHRLEYPLHIKSYFNNVRTSIVISILSIVSSDSKFVFIVLNAVYSSPNVLASFTSYSIIFNFIEILWELPSQSLNLCIMNHGGNHLRQFAIVVYSVICIVHGHIILNIIYILFLHQCRTNTD